MSIFEGISAIGIIGALVFAAWQNSLARKAIRAQSFLNLHQLEMLSRGKNMITTPILSRVNLRVSEKPFTMR